MQNQKPCYVTRVDTFLAEDEVRPYGEEMYISSEKREREITLRLLNRAGKAKKNYNI